MASVSAKLSINWNDFQSTMTGSFGNLWKEEELFDVTLVSDDEVHISAHKVVLAACSSFFKNTFKSVGHSHPLIFLSGMSSSNINSLLEYIYLGKIEIRKEQLESFLETAKKLKITSLLPSLECGAEKVIVNAHNHDDFEDDIKPDLNHEEGVSDESKDTETGIDKNVMNHEEEVYIDGVIESTTKRMLTITKFERKSIKKLVEEDAIMEHEVSQSQSESGSEAIPLTNIENESMNKLAEEDPMKHGVSPTQSTPLLEEKPYTLHNVDGITSVDEVNEKKEEMLYRDRGLLHCRVCGKTGPVRGSNNMRKHVEIHMEGLFYKCRKCYKAYR